MKEIIDTLSDAILATGKPFKDIPKGSITDYLTKVGVNKSKHDEIYQKLSEIYDYKPGYNTVSSNSRNQISDFKAEPSKDTAAITAKTKKREPRKNIFSEITKFN